MRKKKQTLTHTAWGASFDLFYLFSSSQHCQGRHWRRDTTRQDKRHRSNLILPKINEQQAWEIKWQWIYVFSMTHSALDASSGTGNGSFSCLSTHSSREDSGWLKSGRKRRQSEWSQDETTETWLVILQWRRLSHVFFSKHQSLFTCYIQDTIHTTNLSSDSWLSRVILFFSFFPWKRRRRRQYYPVLPFQEREGERESENIEMRMRRVGKRNRLEWTDDI